LQTLYGGEAQLLLEGAFGGGTVVRITMPFRTVR
jgi:hypothetical protein